MALGEGSGETKFSCKNESDKANIVYREKAFVSSEFKDYNPRVEYHAAKLVKAIRKTEGKEVDGSKVMDNYVFDM